MKKKTMRSFQKRFYRSPSLEEWNLRKDNIRARICLNIPDHFSQSIDRFKQKLIETSISNEKKIEGFYYIFFEKKQNFV